MNLLDFQSNFPFYTERLTIRLSSVQDADFLLKLDKQKNTQEYIGGVKNFSREERIEFLKKKEAVIVDDTISYTICLKDGTPVGFVETRFVLDEWFEVCYTFDEEQWNHGYCREALSKIISICVEYFHRNKFIAKANRENHRSIHVLETSGFSFSRFNLDELDFVFYVLYKD